MASRLSPLLQLLFLLLLPFCLYARPILSSSRYLTLYSALPVPQAPVHGIELVKRDASATHNLWSRDPKAEAERLTVRDDEGLIVRKNRGIAMN